MVSLVWCFSDLHFDWGKIIFIEKMWRERQRDRNRDFFNYRLIKNLYLLDFSISPKYLSKVIIWHWCIQIENYKSSLVDILFWRVILNFRREKMNYEDVNFNTTKNQTIISDNLFKPWELKNECQVFFVSRACSVMYALQCEQIEYHSMKSSQIPCACRQYIKFWYLHIADKKGGTQ